jgi:hypothetical protein
MKKRIRPLSKIKKKPTKATGPTYVSEDQKEAHILLRRFEDGKEDPDSLLVPFMVFFGSIFDHAIPDIIAVRVMSRLSFEIRHYADDPKFYAKAWYQEGVYPNAKPQVRAEGSSEQLWIAVALCYLRICTRTARKH